MAAAIAEALRARGVEETVAAMAAEVGVLAFKVRFDAWTPDNNEVGLSELTTAALHRFEGAMAQLH